MMDVMKSATYRTTVNERNGVKERSYTQSNGRSLYDRHLLMVIHECNGVISLETHDGISKDISKVISCSFSACLVEVHVQRHVEETRLCVRQRGIHGLVSEK